MKRFVVPGIVAVCAVLAGCGAAGPVNAPDTSQTDENQWFSVHHVPVDGRTVTCLVESDAGAVSCDWDHAR